MFSVTVYVIRRLSTVGSSVLKIQFLKIAFLMQSAAVMREDADSIVSDEATDERPPALSLA